MSSRRRAKKRVMPKGKFAAIPVDLAKFAMQNLTACEFRVWFAICAQSQIWSNGTAFLNKTVIEEFGLGSSQHVASGVKRMLELGLIVRTRAPRQHVAARYGVKFLPLNHDAIEKAGFSASTGEVLAANPALQTGEALTASTGEALTLQQVKRWTQKQASALQQVKHKGPFSGVSALQQVKPSKNLPYVPPTSDDAEGVLQ